MSLPEYRQGILSLLATDTHTREYIEFVTTDQGTVIPLYPHDKTTFIEGNEQGNNGFDLANAFLHAKVVHPGNVLEFLVDLRNGEPPITQTAMYWEPQALTERAVHAFLPAEPHPGMGLMLHDSIVGWRRVGHIDLSEWAEKAKTLTQSTVA